MNPIPERDELHIDAGDGGDWNKGYGGWDLWKPGWLGLIDNVDDMRRYLATSQMSVETFKKLPLYRSHVGQPGYEWLSDL